MAPDVHTFAVYPSALDETFDPFLLDVPTLGTVEAAARRAWWAAFHRLGAQGIEPEQFTVCAWVDDAPGQLVTAGGFASSATRRAGA